ncbi:MAG: hypothetical protein JW854_06520 [Actinobacteria bacterium]|nr:hypothetical protein [Actinomycetota bacterium]
MEEEKEQPFIFMGRWRGRKLWTLACAAVLAAALVLLMVWAIPASRGNDERAEAAQQETSQPAAAEEPDAGQQPESAQPAGADSPTITPGTGGQTPGVVVDFPDPAGESPQAPAAGYEDICGHWSLDMSGSAYGLTNCHIFLEEDGTISSPPDYDQVFEIAFSSYTWKKGSPSFAASLQLMLKMSSSQVLIPVQIELAGTVSDSLAEVNGDFTAEPQGEPYAPYGQQGTFVMHR